MFLVLNFARNQRIRTLFNQDGVVRIIKRASTLETVTVTAPTTPWAIRIRISQEILCKFEGTSQDVLH